MPETEFKLARAGDVALVTIDNGEDYTKPTFFGRTALASLDGVLDELERGDYAALVLTGKPFVFAAGADLNEFHGASAELARDGSRAGHDLFSRLAALPFPAASRSPSTATRARSRARSGTSRLPRSSSASSPPGAGRS